MKHEFVVTAADAGRRLDRFVAVQLGRVPMSLVRRLLRTKKIRVDGKRGRADQQLSEGDRVVVHHTPRPSAGTEPPSSPARPYTGPPIEVLAEIDDLLFVAKPAGVACSDDGRDDHALAAWLREFLRDRIGSGEVRPEPCHRLDRHTTGVVVVALTAAAFDRFRRALEHDHVHKTYEVVVHGTPESARFDVDVPLARRRDARTHEPRMIDAGEETTIGGQRARTCFHLLRRSGGVSLLRAEPLTGRTHQIRAHCRIVGLPVVGDPRYGDPALDPDRNGQLLHARTIRLEDGEAPIEIHADWPQDRLRRLLGYGLIDASRA
ncbi:MAG TPA: RluA family pseudouridine synthase [Candidatus Krumholzibacteria bacterium]|nr:RluA family pseudouridine synthase [Candidatus Krumholzibacteria bacterium]